MENQTYQNDHLVRDNYNLRNANDVWGSIPGEVIVYGRDDNDHLIFNKDDLISHSDLQIDSASYKKLLKLKKQASLNCSTPRALADNAVEPPPLRLILF